MDEATSALDIDSERAMYEAIQESELAYISVGHRPSLAQYHDFKLRLKANEPNAATTGNSNHAGSATGPTMGAGHTLEVIESHAEGGAADAAGSGAQGQAQAAETVAV